MAEIIARPEDDGPRLVYADWLEEHGDSDRAEFIRVSIQRGHEAAHGALARVNQRACNGEEWSVWSLPVGWDITCSRKLFDMRWDVEGLRHRAGGVALLVRGFVAEVACRCADWFRHGPAWSGRLPWSA